MYSTIPPAATEFKPGEPLLLAWVDGTVPAGFPSPAADFAVKRHDLNDLLITHPAATFMWEARGLSMIDLGIADGDILVVNRALPPVHKCIVIAEVDGERRTCCASMSLKKSCQSQQPFCGREQSPKFGDRLSALGPQVEVRE